MPGEQADYRKSRADYRAGDQSRTPGRPRQPPRLLYAASAQRCGHQRLAGDAHGIQHVHRKIPRGVHGLKPGQHGSTHARGTGDRSHHGRTNRQCANEQWQSVAPGCRNTGQTRPQTRTIRPGPQNGGDYQEQPHEPLSYQRRHSGAGNAPIQHNNEQHIKHRVHHRAAHRSDQRDTNLLQSSENAVRRIYHQHAWRTQHDCARIGHGLFQYFALTAQCPA